MHTVHNSRPFNYLNIPIVFDHLFLLGINYACRCLRIQGNCRKLLDKHIRGVGEVTASNRYAALKEVDRLLKDVKVCRYVSTCTSPRVAKIPVANRVMKATYQSISYIRPFCLQPLTATCRPCKPCELKRNQANQAAEGVI